MNALSLWRVAATFVVLTFHSFALAKQPVISSVEVWTSHSPSRSSRFCPGAYAMISGSDLAPDRDTNGNVLGLSVTVGGRPAPVLGAWITGITIQIPVELTPGRASITVQYLGESSAPFPIELDAFAPFILIGGLFDLESMSSLEQWPFLKSDGTVGTNRNPALEGETVTIAASGLGPTSPPVGTGVRPPDAPFPATITRPRVTVSGIEAIVVRSGLRSRVANYEIDFIVPPGLPPGRRHPMTISIGGFTSNTEFIPVNVLGLGVSQRGFTFQSTQQVPTPLSQSFSLVNGTTQRLDVNVSASTLSGGSSWLAVSPAPSAVEPGRISPPITVTTNSSGLAPGDYYGQIRIDAPGAPNSPQLVSVVLSVVPPEKNLPPMVLPGGLVFIGTPSQGNPAAQTIQLTNLTSRSVSFTAAVPSGNQRWLTVSPASGTVTSNQPVSVSVQANLSGLAVDSVYRGRVNIQIAGEPSPRSVEVVLVVSSSLNPTVSKPALREGLRADATCVPRFLFPAVAMPGAGFESAVAWPTTIEVSVRDSCGSPMKAGRVTAFFSNGDPPVSLTSLQDGRWTGTWAAINPRNSDLVLTVSATDGKIGGSSQVTGSAQPNPDVPIVAPNGVVSSASYSSEATPSPGGLVSVFGTNLADGTEVAGSLPLVNTLQGTTMVLGGNAMPLVFASAGQVNAQVPYGLSPGIHQVIARRGNRISVPQSVTVAATEPGIFSVDGTGKGQGHIYVITESGQQALADSASPARAGDVLVIYCTGLGEVLPTVTSGAAVPADTLRHTFDPLAVNIGGITAPVLFAGLTPGLVGLYQVNVTVPPGVSPGDKVPVTLSIAGNQSRPVMMAVQEK